MKLLRALQCAMGFLTRIPVATMMPPPRVVGLSVTFFPMVGLLLGAILALVHWLLRDCLHAPPHVLWAVLLVTLHVLLTGGLHLDGLADVSDGLGGGGRDRERTMTIMRDSRIGSFGTISLVLLLLTKVFATLEILRSPHSILILLIFPVVARFAAVLLIVLFPYARPDGLGRDFHDHSGWLELLMAAALTTAAVLISGIPAMIAAPVAIACALLVGLWLWRRLGGLTGDVYGAAIELSELAFLLAFAVPEVIRGQG